MSLLRNRQSLQRFARAVGVIALSAVFLAGLSDARSGSGTVGTVTFAKGSCSMAKSSSAGWKPIKQKQAVVKGARLKTDKDSRLEVKLTDGSMLRLGANSELNLDHVSVNKRKKKKSVRAKLVIGRIWASVTKLFSSDSKFEVTTANAVAGVRGTRFAASRDKDGTTRVKVYSGKVLVSNKPVYAVKGHTKAKRVQVAGPREISKDQWEEMIAGAMQVVKVASNGDMDQPETFAMVDPAVDDWEAWNNERDKAAGITE